MMGGGEAAMSEWAAMETIAVDVGQEGAYSQSPRCHLPEMVHLKRVSWHRMTAQWLQSHVQFLSKEAEAEAD